MKHTLIQPLIRTVLSAAVLSLPLTGCSLFEKETPAATASEPAKTDTKAPQETSKVETGADLTAAPTIQWASAEAPVPQAVDSVAGAQITLVDDPRFVASEPSKAEPSAKSLRAYTTVIKPETQTYQIRFTEPMQRNTVEQAVNANLNNLTKVYYARESAKATATFVWQDDQTVQVTVTPKVLPTKPSSSLGYLVDANGAKTKTNQLRDNMPIFAAMLDLPKHLWRVSLESGKSEKLGLPSSYYHTYHFLTTEQRYLLLERSATYCECDSDPGSIHDLYDLKTNQLTRYNIKLYTNYRGTGKFYVDRRGFMFAADTEEAAKVAEASGSRVIAVDLPGFVHGAVFSKDFSKLLVALGEEGQKKDFDFVIYDVGSRQTRTFAKALPAFAEQSQVDSRIYPVNMKDDSKYVSIQLGDGKDLTQHWFRYDWSTSQITPWTPPTAPGQEGYFDFTASAKGDYMVSHEKKVYQQEQSVMDLPELVRGVWMPVSDQFVALQEKAVQAPAAQTQTQATQPKQTAQQAQPATAGKPQSATTNQPQAKEYSLHIVDPATKTSKPLLPALKVPVEPVGVDQAEKWLYILADARVTSF